MATNEIDNNFDVEQLQAQQTALKKMMEANHDLQPPDGNEARRRMLRTAHKRYIHNLEKAVNAIDILIQYLMRDS